MTRRALLIGALWSALAGCGDAPGSAEVLLDLTAFQGAPLAGMSAPRATLDVFDARGEPAVVAVVLGAEQRRVTSPVPMICDPGSCRLQLVLDPGRYAMRLRVTAEDRCGTEAELLELVPDLGTDAVSVSPHESLTVPFMVNDASFDDDGDGIANILEPLVCGRFDVVDRDRPAAECLPERAGCCARPSSPLEGRMSAFAGGAHVLKDGTSIVVDPFALDATEATFGTLERCIAAGRCLQFDREHKARARLDDAQLDRSLPITGLTPLQAAEVCAFLDKRLPTDAEWDFAAAHRDDGDRGRYPWDDDALDLVLAVDDVGHATPPASPTVGCLPDDAPAANHAAHGAACPDEPVAVGAYPSSFARRGAGAPLADLAGNVAEWTTEAGENGDTYGVLPDEWVGAMVLRGGGAKSFVELLENDFVVRVKRPAFGADSATFISTIERLSEEAGFRCATSLAAAEDPPGVDEPTCR